MDLSRFFIIGLIISLVGCSQGEPYSVQTLKNGKEVKIIGVTKALFAGGETALILAYETDLPLENVTALREEVLDIWPDFQVNVEKSGLNIGGIQARKTKKTSVFTSAAKNYGFIFTKTSSGEWVLNENPK